MTGYFQLIEGDDGAFMFTLRAGNHETVLTSRVFWSRQAALDAAALLGRQAQRPECYVRHTDPDGRQWFEVLDERQHTLARSEPYGSRSGLAAGMASVKRNSQANVFRGLVRRANVGQYAQPLRPQPGARVWAPPAAVPALAAES